MKRVPSDCLVLASVAWLLAAPAHAHFKLLQPASWLNEDMLGGPQKGSPCGPGNTRPFIGDDVQPVPVSGVVNTFQAGDTIQVQWQETVYHPGYFRISIAEVAPADASSADFPDPALTDTDNCHYDQTAVQTGAHDNVLADGLFMVDDPNGTPRSLMESVRLPDQPCEHCTLQVVQVMEGHPAASCFYFHCAELKIVAANGGSSGSAGSAAGAGGATAAPASSHASSGCSVASPGSDSSSPWGSKLALCLVAAALIGLRRNTKRTA